MSTFGSQYVYMHGSIGLCSKNDFVARSEFSPCPGLHVTEKSNSCEDHDLLLSTRWRYASLQRGVCGECAQVLFSPLEYRLRRYMPKKVNFQSD